MDNNEPISHHDVEKLNEALARKEVAYLFIGKGAAVLHGFPDTTSPAAAGTGGFSGSTWTARSKLLSRNSIERCISRTWCIVWHRSFAPYRRRWFRVAASVRWMGLYPAFPTRHSSPIRAAGRSNAGNRRGRCEA